MEIYQATHPLSQPQLTALLEPSWNPAHVNGHSARPWGKSDSSHVPQDPSVCWDPNGTTLPIGLQEMSAEEKELFMSDVNSPLKIPRQSKDSTHPGAGGQNGRKTSVSHGSAGNYPVSSPSTASRPGTRRRETTDTNPFPSAGLSSPTSVSRFSRDETSSWFGRKNTDSREPAVEDLAEENLNAREQPPGAQPIGTLNRNNPPPGASSFAAASTIWGNTSTSSPGIGGFGNFSLASHTPAEKRFGGPSGSRLAHLMTKESTESVQSRAGEGANPDMARSWRARPRTDTDPFQPEDHQSGTTNLRGRQDSSPPPLPTHPQRSGLFDTPVKGGAGDFGMSGLNIASHGDGVDTATPETNPYQSPPADRGEYDHEAGMDRSHTGNIGGEHPSSFNAHSRAFATNTFDGSDRSQTSSVGARGHSVLNNLTSGGWPAGPSSGTPDRERPAFTSAFGSSIFSPVGDLQSPSLSSLGGIFAAPNPSTMSGTGSLRGGKLGSLFPPAMQAQMQTQDQEHLSDSIPDLRQTNPLGAIGRGPIGSQARDTDSPLRSGRGAFEEFFQTAESARMPLTTGEQGLPGLMATTQGQPFTPTTAAAPFSSNQAPADPQSRVMVMPDRMRWVYLDPQGQVQGPFTGLEMNDWYKAQFFSPDLRVRKVEDGEFEPLGQVIRRIGNSREPFLVPQIGIPHGPPSQAGGPFSPGDTRGAVPPLQGAFPSFGRTLTAEEQNNLERRKQEEQFLMARQREFMAHHQGFGKVQMQGAAGAAGSLQHHSSAQSLQSQPSFGSMTSPIGMPTQAPIGAIGANAGFFEPPANMGQGTVQPAIGSSTDLFPQDLNLQERQILAGLQGSGPATSGFPGQPIGAPSTDVNFVSHLPSADQLHNDSQGFSARLKEFQEIRAQREAEEIGKSSMQDIIGRQSVSPTTAPTGDRPTKPTKGADNTSDTRDEAAYAAYLQQQQQPSLTEQVQHTQAQAAAAAVASATSKAQETEDVWNKPFNAGLPMPFPPPSSTPLPAPTAQRGRSTLPTQFNSPTPSGTPDTLSEPAQPPPLAPWAPQPGTGSQKGPSLKEIQEMEAKKAAKAEEAAAALRRAQLEQEAAAIRERERVNAAVASGLPSTSTWGTGSPVNAPTGGSTSTPWAKPAAVKTGAPSTMTGGASNSASAHKKTLADIQREEEARKNKARETAVQASTATASSMGKRYADLASKTSAPPGLANHGSAPATTGAGAATQASSAGGWATVGAGGKVKIPTGPASQNRAPSSSSVKPSVPPAAKPVPKPVADNNVPKDNGNTAMDEFHKWLHRELARGLNDDIKDSKLPISRPPYPYRPYPLRFGY